MITPEVDPMTRRGSVNDLFIEAVAEMRMAQRSYFKNRHPDNLRDSKRLEIEVDGMLKLLCKSSEPDLFSPE